MGVRIWDYSCEGSQDFRFQDCSKLDDRIQYHILPDLTQMPSVPGPACVALENIFTALIVSIFMYNKESKKKLAQVAGVPL